MITRRDFLATTGALTTGAMAGVLHDAFRASA